MLNRSRVTSSEGKTKLNVADARQHKAFAPFSQAVKDALDRGRASLRGSIGSVLPCEGRMPHPVKTCMIMAIRVQGELCERERVFLISSRHTHRGVFERARDRIWPCHERVVTLQRS